MENLCHAWYSETFINFATFPVSISDPCCTSECLILKPLPLETDRIYLFLLFILQEEGRMTYEDLKKSINWGGKK